jgi:hypothetical protein
LCENLDVRQEYDEGRGKEEAQFGSRSELDKLWVL